MYFLYAKINEIQVNMPGFLKFDHYKRNLGQKNYLQEIGAANPEAAFIVGQNFRGSFNNCVNKL